MTAEDNSDVQAYTFNEIDVMMFSPDKRCIDVVGNSGKAVTDEPWVSGIQYVSHWPAAVPPIAVTLQASHRPSPCVIHRTWLILFK